MLEKDETGPKSVISYLGALLLCAAVALGISWIYTSTQAVRFLESGYSVWDAKRTLLRDCNLGDVAVFGDSRADSAFIPARMSKLSTNFGFAGGTPIENYFFVKSILACNTKPRLLILSFNPGAFEIVQPWLWDNALRYGALGWDEISQVRHEAERLEERSYFVAKPHIGIDGLFRDVAYSTRFPAIYFNSLIESRLLLRTEENHRKYAEVISARGYPAYKSGAQVRMVDASTDDAPFTPLPLQQRFFEMTVSMLKQAGIETYFLIAPFSENGPHAHNQAYQAAYIEFLRRTSLHHQNLHLMQDQVPVWPNSMFADGVHLNRNGADVFSRQLNQCIEANSPVLDLHATCGFQWVDQAVDVNSVKVQNRTSL
jgi:hypothetical protein